MTSEYFDRRIIDNTLPQSACHYINRHGERLLDPASSQAFSVYVDTFINAKIRCVTLPGRWLGQGDPLTSLWHTTAADIISGTTSLYSDDEQIRRMLVSFSISLDASPEGWAGWLCLQLTSVIARQFKSRVIDWRARLARAVNDIALATTPMVPRPEARIIKFRDSILAPKLRHHFANEANPDDQLDHEFRTWARREGIELAEFAVAYAYDWYCRGRSYASIGASACVAFHPLRADVVTEVDGEWVTPFQGADEVKWSRIISAYLTRGILPYDTLVICELLQALRAGVYDDKRIAFIQRVSDAYKIENVHVRHRNYRDAVVDVLLNSGIQPIIRKSVARDDKDSAANKIASTTLQIAGLGEAAPVVGELVRCAGKSSLASVARYRIEKRFRPKSVWRTYEIPGLTTQD